MATSLSLELSIAVPERTPPMPAYLVKEWDLLQTPRPDDPLCVNDVKPDNILVSRHPNGVWRAVIMDWDCAAPRGDPMRCISVDWLPKWYDHQQRAHRQPPSHPRADLFAVGYMIIRAVSRALTTPFEGCLEVAKRMMDVDEYPAYTAAQASKEWDTAMAKGLRAIAGADRDAAVMRVLADRAEHIVRAHKSGGLGGDGDDDHFKPWYPNDLLHMSRQQAEWTVAFLTRRMKAFRGILQPVAEVRPGQALQFHKWDTDLITILLQDDKLPRPADDPDAYVLPNGPGGTLPFVQIFSDVLAGLACFHKLRREHWDAVRWKLGFSKPQLRPQAPRIARSVGGAEGEGASENRSKAAKAAVRPTASPDRPEGAKRARRSRR